MRKNVDLNYLYHKPKMIWWTYVAGPELEDCQMHDLVFDEYDYNIRGLKYSDIKSNFR